MVMGQAGSQKQSIVTAEQFVLQDKNGKERGRFIADYNGSAGIALRDSNGKIRFATTVKGNGDTSLNIYGKNNQRAWLSPLARSHTPVSLV